MKSILRSHFITSPSNQPESFDYKVNAAIEDMQTTGLEVEVQFQASAAGFAALVLGRKAVEE